MSKTDETKKENIVVETHTETTKQPDGTTKVVTNTTEHEAITDHTTDVHEVDKIPVKTGRLNVSLMGSLDVTKGLQTLDYGLAVTKEILGPITLGVYGMRSGVVGLSIGLDF